MDCYGRVWTAMESEAFHSGLCGRLWTVVDAAWRSTDQKVGSSNLSGRATRNPCSGGGFGAPGARRRSANRPLGAILGSHSPSPATFDELEALRAIDMCGCVVTRFPLGSAGSRTV